MNPLARIAEQRISQAIEDGSLSFEKWKNKPLILEDDHFVPDDLKIAYKMLKNSGYLPPEIGEKKEIQRIEDLIASTEDEHVRIKQMKKLNLMLMKVDSRRGKPQNITLQDEYYSKIVERVSLYSQAEKKSKR